jgi:enamine deaminase RidA (YjgF/YER057c/UK114 family)
VERRIINPWTWQDQLGYVQANETSGAQRTIFLSVQTSVDDEGRPVHPDDMGAQTEQAMDNLETVLREAGATLSDVVRLNIYTTDVDAFFESYGGMAGRLAEAGCRPASTLLGVTRLALPELLVEIEATAVLQRATEQRPPERHERKRATQPRSGTVEQRASCAGGPTRGVSGFSNGSSGLVAGARGVPDPLRLTDPSARVSQRIRSEACRVTAGTIGGQRVP